MAIIATPTDSALTVSFQSGLTPAGAPIIQKKTFSNVKNSAGDENCYQVIQGFFSLTQCPVTLIRRENRVELTLEEEPAGE